LGYDMRPLLVCVASAFLVASIGAAPAVAQEPPQGAAPLLERPHTLAELEAGIIALPGAPISAANRGGATPLGTVGNGDATVQTGIHLLYRATPEWAIGAGAIFAPRPTTDPNYLGGGIPRTHSRSYLFLGGEARYFPLRSKWVEGWVGLTAGAILIADRFTTNATPDPPPILGSKTTTVSTEGFAVGIQIGGDYLVTDHLIVGLALRADRWILPTQPEQPFTQQSSCDAIGDCPTLTGSVAAFELGLTVGYRLTL
jgi:hypothetical protein